MTETDAMPTKKMLRLRKRVKGRKPQFVRPESWRYYRLKESWRNPRGLDHKVRLMYKGWPPAASSGYGGPKLSRNLHPSGYREVVVFNVEQLGIIEPKVQAIRISHTIGKKKKANILAEARRRKIVILNLREARETTKKRATEEAEEAGKETETTEVAVEADDKQEKGETKKRKERPEEK